MPENRSNDGHNREQMRGIMAGMGNVSVVITSYNQNEMIREAVDSVRRQTLRPDAIIVVDANWNKRKTSPSSGRGTPDRPPRATSASERRGPTA